MQEKNKVIMFFVLFVLSVASFIIGTIFKTRIILFTGFGYIVLMFILLVHIMHTAQKNKKIEPKKEDFIPIEEIKEVPIEENQQSIETKTVEIEPEKNETA